MEAAFYMIPFLPENFLICIFQRLTAEHLVDILLSSMALPFKSIQIWWIFFCFIKTNGNPEMVRFSQRPITLFVFNQAEHRFWNYTKRRIIILRNTQTFLG